MGVQTNNYSTQNGQGYSNPPDSWSNSVAWLNNGAEQVLRRANQGLASTANYLNSGAAEVLTLADSGFGSAVNYLNSGAQDALVLADSGFGRTVNYLNTGAQQVLIAADRGIARGVNYLNSGAEQVFDAANRGMTNAVDALNEGAETALAYGKQGIRFANAATRQAIGYLNSGTDYVLDTLAAVGAAYDRSKAYADDSVVNLLQRAGDIDDIRGNLGSIAEYMQQGPLADKYVEGAYATGIVGKSVGKIANGLDAVTGSLELLSALNKDRLSGDTTYRGTLTAALKSTSQIAATRAVGTLAAATVTTALSGVAATGIAGLAVAAAPLALGVAAGMAAGWAVGKLLG